VSHQSTSTYHPRGNPKHPTASSHLRTSLPHLLRHIRLIQRKRLAEHTPELPDLAFKRLRVLPRHPRVEQLARDALDCGGHLQVEDPKGLVLGLGELSRVHGVDDPTRVLERAPRARAELAPRPARVDQPAVDVVLRHPLREHLCVPAWVQDDERCGIAGGEGRDRLEHAVFCAGCFPVMGMERVSWRESDWEKESDLRGVSSQEVVLGLFWGKLAHGRKDTKRVTGQHDDIARLAVDYTGNLGIRNVLDRVRTARVLRDSNIVVIRRS
jgi:hypothetical protein